MSHPCRIHKRGVHTWEMVGGDQARRRRESERKGASPPGGMGTWKETEAARTNKRVIHILLVKRKLNRDQEVATEHVLEKAEEIRVIFL